MNRNLATQYVNSFGTLCPYCGTLNIDAQSIDIDAGFATQKITCENGHTWDDIYQLAGIYDRDIKQSFYAEPKSKKHYYLITMWDGIEPEGFGPFESEAIRDAEAKHLKEIGAENSDIFSLDIICEETPPKLTEVRAYSEEFFSRKEI